MGLLLAAGSEQDNEETGTDEFDGHGAGTGHGGHGARRVTQEDVDRYRRMRESLERRVREHADALIGYVEPAEPQEAPPELTPAPTMRPDTGWPRPVAPVRVVKAPAYDPAYARQQTELLRLEIERVTQAIAAAEAELELARIEAERAAFMLRDEDDVMVLLLAA